MSGLFLPKHIAIERYGMGQPEPEDRPEIYQHGDDPETAIFVVNAPDYTWRIPPDELRAMALEVERDRPNSEHAQSQADRFAAFQARWYEHLDKRNLAVRGAIVLTPKGRF